MLYIIVVISVLCFFNNCLSETSVFTVGNRQNEKYNYKKDEDKYYADFSPLTEFMEKYVNKININYDSNTYTTVKSDTLEIPKFKGALYSLQNCSTNKHKQGWVTLEAIPWSISKVSKWESKSKPKDNNYSDTMHMQDLQHLKNMNLNGYNYRESTISNPLIADGIKFKDNFKPWEQLLYNEAADDDRNNYLNKDVITTDGLLPNFPVEQGDLNQRYSTLSTELTETYPFRGNGEWILLSATKGYKHPKNKLRSLPILSSSTHTSVRSAVIPAVRNTKVNISRSHGEVSQQLQTLVTNVQPGRRIVSGTSRSKMVKDSIIDDNDVQPTNKVTKTVEKETYLDSSAIAAAVGAGMIPATLALLVPFAMGSKEQRIND